MNRIRTNRIRTKRLMTAAVATLAGFALAGCTASEPDLDSAPSTIPAGPDPDATTPPPPSSSLITIPDCEDLVPDERIRQYEPWSDVGLIATGEQPGLAGLLPSEEAAEASLSASQGRVCFFDASLAEQPSQMELRVYTLQITPERRESLVDSLRESTSYTEYDVDGAPSFAMALDEGMGAETVSYTFEGEAWVVQLGTLIDVETAEWIAAPAVAALRAANS